MRRFKGLWVTGDFLRGIGSQGFPWTTADARRRGACPLPGWSSATRIGGASWRARPSPVIRLIVDNELVEIIGVTPPGFFGMVVGDHFDIALPFCQPKEGLSRHIFDVSVIGRLRTGWTIQRARQKWMRSARHFRSNRSPGPRGTHHRGPTKVQARGVPGLTGVSALRGL